MSKTLDTSGLNQILRECLGADVWAQGMLAAVSQDAPDDYIREELANASPDEIKALVRVMKRQTDLVEIFTNAKTGKVNARGSRLVVRVHP